MEAFLQGVIVRLLTLLSRITAGRATNLDNLNATVSSRATQASVDTVDTVVDGIATTTTGIDTKVGTANPASAGTDSLFKYFKKIDDKNIGGIDWATKSPRGAIGNQGLGYATLLDIPAGSGYLLSISQRTLGEGAVKVTIDAGEPSERIIEFASASIPSNPFALSMTWYFAESLLVEHGGGADATRTAVSYVLD